MTIERQFKLIMSGQLNTQILSDQLMQEIERLTLYGPTFEIALTALRLQTAIRNYEFLIDHGVCPQIFSQQGDVDTKQ